MRRRRTLLIALCGCLLTSCMFGSRNKRQILPDLGSVELPTRLKPSGSREASFNFDRTSGSFFLIGSNRPVNENLIIAFWPAGSRDQTYAKARSEAPERTSGIAWRREGDYEIGEGTHEVNAHTHKAWIVIREAPDKQAVAGYMVWDGTQSLAEAKRTVDHTLASLKLDRPVADYLRLVADRPAKNAAIRRAAFQQLIDAQGLAALKTDGPIIEHNGAFYHLVRDDFPDEIFLGIYALGSLPAARHFRVDYSSPPKGISNWPQICWYQSEGAEWKSSCEARLTPAMTMKLNQRHTDPRLAYFYAVVFDLPSDSETPEAAAFRSPLFWRALEPMQARFAKGDLVTAVRE